MKEYLVRQEEESLLTAMFTKNCRAAEEDEDLLSVEWKHESVTMCLRWYMNHRLLQEPGSPAAAPREGPPAEAGWQWRLVMHGTAVLALQVLAMSRGLCHCHQFSAHVMAPAPAGLPRAGVRQVLLGLQNSPGSGLRAGGCGVLTPRQRILLGVIYLGWADAVGQAQWSPCQKDTKLPCDWHLLGIVSMRWCFTAIAPDKGKNNAILLSKLLVTNFKTCVKKKVYLKYLTFLVIFLLQMFLTLCLSCENTHAFESLAEHLFDSLLICFPSWGQTLLHVFLDLFSWINYLPHLFSQVPHLKMGRTSYRSVRIREIINK